MGISEILRSYQKQAGDESQNLGKAVKEFVSQSRQTKSYIERKKMWDNVDLLYNRAEELAIERVKGAGGQDEFILSPKANQLALTFDEARNQLMEADSPPTPQAAKGAEISDMSAIESLADQFEDYRNLMDYHGLAAERSLALIKYATCFVYVGFDPNLQYRGEIDSEYIEPEEEELKEGELTEEKEGEESVVLEQSSEEIQEVPTPEGDLFFELLLPAQMALDAEAETYDRSRTVVIERFKTRDDLLAMFHSEKEEIKKTIDEVMLKASGKTDTTRKDSTYEQPVKFYEVFIDPAPFSEFYPKGLHAFVAEETVLKTETAYWQKGNRPVVQYIMEIQQAIDPEYRSPWGYCKLQRIVPLQILLDSILGYMALNAKNDVGKVFYKKGAVKPEEIDNDPGLPTGVDGSPADAVFRLQPSRNAPALIQFLNEIKSQIEEISQIYSLKHGFKGGQRLATEIDALLERQAKAYSEPMRHIGEADKQLWRALYFLGVRHGKFEEVGSTPLDVDFVITGEEVPMPKALMRQRLNQDAAAGLMGPLLPNGALSPEAAAAVIEARRQMGDSVFNPIYDLMQDVAERFIQTIEAGGPEPVCSEYWNIPLIVRKLDIWALEQAKIGSLTPQQVAAYGLIRENLERKAMIAEIKHKQLQIEAAGAVKAFAQAVGLVESAGAGQQRVPVGPGTQLPEDVT